MSRLRRIPSRVKRAVWTRDGGQCTFEGPVGRCSERGFLEFHHKDPFAAGGEPTLENIALMCRAHNALEGERFFGAALMGRRASAGLGSAVVTTPDELGLDRVETQGQSRAAG
jgi:5-methylcytosine-specific restriction endonuclease McrA